MSKAWFVTGASTGFGLELAKAVIARGDRLLATARNPDTLRDLQANAPDRVWTAALDVTNAQQIAAAVRLGEESLGGIDVVINNAGYGLIGSLEEVTPAQIERNYATNLLGPLNIMRAVTPGMRARKRGLIINMSAAAAISNYAGFSIYGSAKAALEFASEALALELAPLGIKVVTVQPGPFRTDFIARSLDMAPATNADYQATVGKFQTLLKSMSGKQPGDPAAAARLIVSLADEPSPPLRIALGKYAVGKVKRMLAARQAELNMWESRGLATDFGAGG